MKRRLKITIGAAGLMIGLLIFNLKGFAAPCLPAAKTESQALCEELDSSLHARAAVLMDGDKGRVLYGKNPDEFLPMASTTKIMTLIVALENASLDELVTVSAYAAGMPDVQLGIREGEVYVLKDLLYSMMLESHNDSAVAIAEHVGGSVEGFAALMNEKAEGLGCTSTYFITPNGLDAKDSRGIHGTTARDLALIMRYGIQNEMFLKITRTMSYSFTDQTGNRSFDVNNKNALLTMTPEAVSGKTGFTSGAGYCYVCAVSSEGRSFIIALLGCGWPPNKSWKWEDVSQLMDYGKENYHYVQIGLEGEALPQVTVINGTEDQVSVSCKARTVDVLLRQDEQADIVKTLVTQVQAPVTAGKRAGTIEYVVGDTVLYSYAVNFSQSSEIKDLSFYFRKTGAFFLFGLKSS